MKKRFNTRDIILAGLFCGLMIVGANLRIQFGPIPLTFQPFFAILSGLLLGPVLALSAQTTYILLGLAGIPVFAGSAAGPAYVLQASFGYLLGFMLGAWLAGIIAGRREKPSFLRIMAASAAGLVAIYALGIPYAFLIQSVYLGKTVSLVAMTIGMMPYFIKDAVLFCAASILAFRLVPLIRRSRD